VIVKLERRTAGDWRQVSVNGASGWARTALLWGADD
jgi:SH3-like domain-containing protein